MWPWRLAVGVRSGHVCAGARQLVVYRNGQSMEDYRPMVSSKCPKSYVQLMTMCLDRTAEKRPDFLGGTVNVVVELERLIHEEYQKMASGAAAAAR